MESLAVEYSDTIQRAHADIWSLIKKHLIIIIISEPDIDLESGSPTRGALTLVDWGVEVMVTDYVLRST